MTDNQCVDFEVGYDEYLQKVSAFWAYQRRNKWGGLRRMASRPTMGLNHRTYLMSK